MNSIVSIPREVYASELPAGYEATLYLGRMVGQLKPLPTNSNFSQFSFEMADVDDPTEWILKYSLLEAGAEELARWEVANDTVGVVIANKGKRMSMVMAYNFTRRKWFGLGDYPHVKDRFPGGDLTIAETHNLVMLSIPLIFTCIGIVLLPIGLILNGRKSQQVRVLNPTDFRGVLPKRLADWITTNVGQLGSRANPALDPSL